MELRHIRYFIVLAEELNFSRAAERLHISQPPLSRQIKQLEEHVGAKLFIRTKRQVVLSDAGKVFLQKAYQIMDQIEQASISTRLSSTGIEGGIHVGFNSIIQDLIPLLKAYRSRFPEVSISLHQMNSIAQIEALHEKIIDIGVISIPVNHHKIATQPMTPIPFKLVMSADHPLANAPSIAMRDLAEETFIITPKSIGQHYYDTFMSAFQHVDYTPQMTIQASDLQSVIALVTSGMGIALSPTPRQNIQGIITREVEDIDLILQPTIVWRKDNHSEILQKFLAFLAEMQI